MCYMCIFVVINFFRLESAYFTAKIIKISKNLNTTNKKI